MKSGKQVIRRTFSQERFEILIKKQKSGEATFRDLTELDEIVNRVPDIRLTILEEMEGDDVSGRDNFKQDIIIDQPLAKRSFFEKIKKIIAILRFNPALLLPIA
jgi:hypothetical protein